MDKETLSNYGWIVICVLVLAVMLAFATPFGTFIADGFKATYTGLFQTGDSALDVGLSAVGVSNKLPCGHGRKEAGDHSQKECGHYNCQDTDCGCVPAACGIEGHWSGDGKDHGIATTSRNCYSGHRYTCECTPSWTIPEGGEYRSNYIGTLTAGQQMPCGYEPRGNDFYYFGNYQYGYNMYAATAPSWGINNAQNGWGVRCTNNVANPGPILETLFNKPIVTMTRTFENCTNLSVLPKIPNTVTTLSNCFNHCESIVDASELVVPNSVTSMERTFIYCTSLKVAPIIPNAVTDIECIFTGCSNLTKVTINATPTVYEKCFWMVDMKNVSIAGSCDATMKQTLANTGTNGSQVTIID